MRSATVVPMRRHRLCVLLAICGLACSPLVAVDAAQPARTRSGEPAAAEINLRPRFVQGKVHKFQMELGDKEIPAAAPRGTPPPKGKKPGSAPNPPANATPTTSAFRQQVGISMTVESVDAEGNASLAVKLDTFKMTGDGPMGKVDFDSSKPANAQDPMDALFRSITTTTFKVIVDRNGEVKSMGSEGSSGVGALIAGNITGGDFMKSLVGPIFSPRPSRPTARVGDTWTEEAQMKASAGDWTLVTTKTVRSHSGGKAVIDVKGHVKIDPSSLGGNTGANPKTETILQGQAVWNTDDGMVDSVESKMLSEVGLMGGLGALGSVGDLTGGLGGVDGEAGATSKPAKHETTVRIKRVR
jgi:hypothetical protein